MFRMKAQDCKERYLFKIAPIIIDKMCKIYINIFIKCDLSP